MTLQPQAGAAPGLEPNSPYAILFEPVRIGPVVAPNRFYATPHGNGTTARHWRTDAGFRAMKAEGGWGVVSSGVCSVHPSGECDEAIYNIWSEDTIPAHAHLAESIHRHGALAAIELNHFGADSHNILSRMTPLAPSPMATQDLAGRQSCRQMDKADIRAVLDHYRQAALRARTAGFDIVYCYAAHGYALPMQFLSRRYNERTDEYGGGIENRARFLRQLLETMKDAVGDSCAIALRFSTDELMGSDGITWQEDGRAVVELLSDVPDLWDVNVSNWGNDSSSSRFRKEGWQQEFTGFVKQVTKKPVVAVGRYTSPDAMAALVRGGIADFVGAARTSIADPFLPAKIQRGEAERIRECIGCNVCVAFDNSHNPTMCTQNPTICEEWRQDWHPEHVPAAQARKRLLVIGAGPAGLEAARVLGERGHEVHLAEKSLNLGGRVLRESSLPGLVEWKRVVDWRVAELNRLPNVHIYRDSAMGVAEVEAFGADHTVFATGSHWRRDGKGLTNRQGIAMDPQAQVLTPDDVWANGLPAAGHLLVFDDEQGYLAGCMAEMAANKGLRVTYVTPDNRPSPWTSFSMEQPMVVGKLVNAGVAIRVHTNLERVDRGSVRLQSSLQKEAEELAVDAVLLVTDQLSDHALYRACVAAAPAGAEQRFTAIGDCDAPGLIAHAVYAGHRFGRTFGEPVPAGLPFRVE